MANALAGTMFATIDGRSSSVTGEGTYVVSAEKRESLSGQSGYHGYSAMRVPGKMSWKGRDSSAVNMTEMNAIAGATIVFELANGKVIVGRNMVRVGDPIAVNTEDSSFTIELEGPDVTEN